VSTEASGTEAAGAAAVVLAGGAARRFKDRDKLVHDLDGRAVLSRVLDALAGAGAGPVVVVGPERAGITDGWTTVRESPAGGGPVAGLAAGIAHLRASGSGFDDEARPVLVLAGDLPYLTVGALGSLVAAIRSRPGPAPVDVALAVDDAGRHQYLLGAWRAAALVDALAEHAPPAGRSMRDLVSGRRVAPVRLVEPAAGPAPWVDLDEAPPEPPPRTGPALTHPDP
jgi:molybdopterin-guanine dinucleotide biosynthesis protein A